MNVLKGKPWLAAVAVAVVALIVVGIVLIAGGFQGRQQELPEQTSEPTTVPTEPTETEPLDLDAKTFEQLRDLLLRPEELDITANTDLEVLSSMKVVGVKHVTGKAKLTVQLGLRDSVSVFDVSEGAELEVEGLSIDGNITGDGITVRKGGKVTAKGISVVWPYQFGMVSYGGEAYLEDCSVDNAPTAGVQASNGAVVTVSGGSYTNSQALIMYVENGSTLKVGGDVKMEKSAKHGITNRGELILTGGEMSQCEQYAIVNYGNVTIAYEGEDKDGTISIFSNGKGALYNYGEGHIEAKDLHIYDNQHSAVSNNGVMVLSNTTIEQTGTNGLYNTADFTGDGIRISGSQNCGVYNIAPGTLKMSGSTISSSTKRGVHNKGGVVELSGVSIMGCGTHGIANTVDDYGNAGRLTASGVTVSGARTNVYNEGRGVPTALYGCTLNKSQRTNVVVTYGTMTLNNVKILGTVESGTYCLQLADTGRATIEGNTEITGANARGVMNHGVLTMTGGSIHGNHSTAAGGGISTDGTFYFQGGAIYDNVTDSSGGGICVNYDSKDSTKIGKLYMTGGKVYGNKAAANGGGIYISKGVAYEGKNDGKIIPPYAEITGGEVYGNTAGTGSGIMTAANIKFGGSVYLHDGATLRINNDITAEIVPLTKHTDKDPLLVSAPGATGRVVFTASSEAEAAGQVQRMATDSVTVKLAAEGKTIVTAPGEYVDVGDLDMTGAQQVTVSDFKTLKQEVESTASGTKKVIVLAANITMEGTIQAPAGATVQIRDDGKTRTLIRPASMTEGAFFSVPTGATFGLKASGDKTLVLDGNGEKVKVTTSASSLMTVSGEAHVEGAVLKNNKGDAYGGLINLSAGILEVKNALLTGGDANRGGAMQITGGQATLTDTIVEHCASTNAGGGIRYEGGSLTLVGGEVNYNATRNNSGGGIVVTSGVTLTVTDTIFTGNTTGSQSESTAAHGGAIYVTGSGSKLIATGATFTGNTAVPCGSATNADGGAVAANSTQCELEDCTFIENKAVVGGALYNNGGNMVVNGATFRKNSASASAGVIYIAGAKAVLNATGCTFENNTASTYGGAVNAASKTTWENVVFTNCTFSGNTAKASNNANTLMVSGSSAITVVNCTVTPANETVGDVRVNASGVLAVSEKTVLGRVTFADGTGRIQVLDALTEDSAITVLPSAYTEYAQILTGEAETVAAASVRFSVVPNGEEVWRLDDQGRLVNRTNKAAIGESEYATLADALEAAESGQIIKLLGDVTEDAEIPEGVTLDGDGKTLAGNVKATGTVKNLAVTGDMTVESSQDLSTVTVSGSLTVAGDVEIQVGGGFNAGSIHLQTGATVRLTSALGEVSIPVTSDVEEVGTAILTGDAELIKTEYTKFTLSLEDATLYLGEDGKIQYRPFEATIQGKDGTYDTLEAAIQAAQAEDVILVNGNYTVPGTIQVDKAITIQGAVKGIVLNRGENCTGAIFDIAAGGNLTLTNITVDGKGVQVKAAIINNAGKFTLNADATIKGGWYYASKKAGGLVNNDNATADVYGTFTECKGQSGGAIYNAPNAILRIHDGAWLTKNYSNTSGGALYTEADLTIGKATFEGNQSKNQGGAVNFVSGKVTVNGTIFQGNTAGVEKTDDTLGGAVQVSSKADVTMTDVTVKDNMSLNHGGAFNVGGTLTIVSGTFTGNHTSIEGDTKAGSGGVFSVSGSGTLTITDGTFSGNTSYTGGGVFYIAGSKPVTINGGTFTGNESKTSTGGVMNVAGDATVTINGGTFQGNTASTNGGAVYISGSKALTVTGGTFSGNTGGNGTDISIGAKSILNLGAAGKTSKLTIQQVGKTSANGVITLQGSLSDDSSIGLKLTSGEYAANTQVITVGDYGASCARFTLDNAGFYIDAAGKVQPKPAGTGEVAEPPKVINILEKLLKIEDEG